MEHKNIDHKQVRRYTDSGYQKLAIQVLFLFADRWELNDEESHRLLDGVDEETYKQWKIFNDGKDIAFPPASRVIMICYDYVLNIISYLRQIYGHPDKAGLWQRQPNKALKGMTPRDCVASGEIRHLITLHQHLHNKANQELTLQSLNPNPAQLQGSRL